MSAEDMTVQPMDLDQAELLASVGHAGRVSTALYAEMTHLRARVAAMENELGESRQLHASAERLWYDVSTGLRPLCPCGSNPGSYDGPQRECVLHGDGDTFVAYVQALESVAKAAARHAADLENGECIVKMLHALDALDAAS